MRTKLRGLRRHEAALEEGGRFCGVAAAMIGSAVVGAGANAYSSSQNKKAAQAGAKSAQSMDPRIDNILLGGTGANGLFQQWSHLGDAPMPQGMNTFGQANLDYLQNNSGADLGYLRNAALGLLGGGAKSTFGGEAPSSVFGGEGPAAAGVRVQAPAQNNMNLSGAFDRFINGDAGANPYLLKGQQAAIDATNAGFQKNQTDLTNNLTRNILPSIRGGAIAAGQYGGSRQGIAEANALSDYTNQLTSANTQLGLANSANTTAQQAAAFNQGQDRSLAATLNLSGQQYNTASQNANMAQQNNQFNSNLKFQANQLNQQNNQFNSNLKLQANQMNQQNNQFNAQQANASAATGAGLLSGFLANAYNGANAHDNYKFDNASQTASLLYPMIGQNMTRTSSDPYYSNAVGSAFGGAMSGLSLYDQFSKMGNSSSGVSPYSGAANNWGVSAGTAPVNNSLFSDFSWFGG